MTSTCAGRSSSRRRTSRRKNRRSMASGFSGSSGRTHFAGESSIRTMNGRGLGVHGPIAGSIVLFAFAPRKDRSPSVYPQTYTRPRGESAIAPGNRFGIRNPSLDSPHLPGPPRSPHPALPLLARRATDEASYPGVIFRPERRLWIFRPGPGVSRYTRISSTTLPWTSVRR